MQATLCALGTLSTTTTSGSRGKSFSGPATTAFVEPSVILGIMLIVLAAASLLMNNPSVQSISPVEIFSGKGPSPKAAFAAGQAIFSAVSIRVCPFLASMRSWQ